jgi:diguanylate cyclase (GGDEF)-like protein
MSDLSTESLVPALERVWERHRAAVLAQVDAIEAAVAALANGRLEPAQREAAVRDAHQLAGSLGTFGFTGASEHARRLERAFTADGAADAATAATLAAQVAGLRDSIGELATAVAQPVPTATVAAADAPLLLIVEDDVTLAERLAPEAARRAMRVQLATSPEQARAVVAREPPDGVLLDLVFGDGTDGAYALLSELTSMTPPVPVLVSTVRDTLTDRVEVVRRGGRGFVTKSLPPAQVIDQVLSLIERERAPEATLLAVDDDPALLDAVRTLLAPHGLRVLGLDDPLRFWNELDRIHPDLVLLDVDMPGATGIELCRVLRNDVRWATVPVLVLTARRDAATIEEIFAAGADDYIAKPVVGSELLVRVRNRVERLQLHRALAEIDSLTGVANRHTSTQGLDRLLRLAARYEQPLALAAIDLDRFKLVNDCHGHAAGDAVLRRFGALLRRAFRGEDVVGRWGGEEFVVGMYGMTGRDAVLRLGAVLDELREERFADADGAAFRAAFSAGVAEFPADGSHLVALYHAADAALYRAKDAGRARVALAGEPMPTRA